MTDKTREEFEAYFRECAKLNGKAERSIVLELERDDDGVYIRSPAYDGFCYWMASRAALVVESEKAFANGRCQGLDEAQKLCYQMALGEYRPEGSRFTLFTPKKERMLGDVLVKACNAIADLPDGPYERMRIKREQKDLSNSADKEKCQHGIPSRQSCFDCIGILHGNKP